MHIWIQGLKEGDLSVVRGVGSYAQAMTEALVDFGKEYELMLNSHVYDYVIQPGFFPYAPLSIPSPQKTALVVHDLIPLQHSSHFPAGVKGKLVWWYNRYQLRTVPLILTDTQVVKKAINTMLSIPLSTIKVVRPVAKKFFYHPPRTRESTLELPQEYLLYVGDVTWNKNLVNFAQAVRRMNKTVVLVGKALTDERHINHAWQAQFREFRRLVKDDKRFIFLGFVPDADLIEVYRRAQCLVLPSYSEGFGLPWLEASLLNTPVALSDIPVLRETSDNASAYFDPTSVESIVSVTQQLLAADNTRLIKKQSEVARRYLHKDFVQRLSSVLHNCQDLTKKG